MGDLIHILLVEDNPDDADITREVFEKANLHNSLHVVTDGDDALAFLRKEGQFATAPLPDLILLDLKLPKMDGHEVLAQIKSDARFRTIPVIVFTTSHRDEDIWKSYNLSASCYISKPTHLKDFQKVVQTIEAFWFSIVKLPEKK